MTAQRRRSSRQAGLVTIGLSVGSSAAVRAGPATTVRFRVAPGMDVRDQLDEGPGVVNIQVSGTELFVPDPEGPHVAGVDRWAETTANALTAGLGTVNLTFVDCFTSYHELLGEVHCGANVERTPYVQNWWEQVP